MSYILDALRKSEQQRQHGAVPNLLAVQVAYDANTRPTFLIYGLIAASLIVAGMAIGWSHPWQHEPSPTKDSGTARPFEPEQRAPSRPPSVFSDASRRSGQERSVRVPVAPSDTAGVVAGSIPSVIEAPVQPRGIPRTTEAIPAKTAKAGVTAAPSSSNPIPLQDGAAATIPASVPQEQKLVGMGELPSAIQQEIPAISIQGHAYSSEPKDRIVGINDRLLKEGEYLAPGLRLEQITPDGLVFSYKNYLFRRDL